MPEKKGTPEKVKVNHFAQSSCRMHPSPSLHRTPLPSSCSALGTGGMSPPTFSKAALEHFAARKFFSHATLPPNTISFVRACIVSILRYQRFYRVKDNFLWVGGHVFLTSNNRCHSEPSIVSTTSLCPCSLSFRN